jgi:WD40 repeat protein
MMEKLKIIALPRRPAWKKAATVVRRSAMFLFALALLLPFAAPALAGSEAVFPSILPLPNGFRPEGITIGRGENFYVGSLADGSIYGGSLRTGEGDIVVPPQTGRVAVGLAYDERTNYIYAAGGAGGAGYVYDASSGESVAAFQFTTEASFVNDVVVTRDAAYFTDSSCACFYKVPLSANGDLPNPSEFEVIPLGGDFTFIPNAFNANGIDATPDGKWLVIVNSTEGALYLVDPNTGIASLIDLGGETVLRGDGILLDGKTLYVVQNAFNQISVIQLSPEMDSGEVVAIITSPSFRVPTTIDDFGNALYAVNARFGTPPTPDTEYEVVRVSK